MSSCPEQTQHQYSASKSRWMKMYANVCFSHCSFQYVSHPYKARVLVAFLTIPANLTWKLAQEASMLNRDKTYCPTDMLKERPSVANPGYLHVWFWNPYLQTADRPKPVQRIEFHKPGENMWKFATILALEPSIHFRSSSLCNILPNATFVVVGHVLGRTKFLNSKFTTFVL